MVSGSRLASLHGSRVKVREIRESLREVSIMARFGASAVAVRG